MIPELGNFACIIALGLALLLIVTPWLQRQSPLETRLLLVRSTAIACAMMILFGFFCLIYSFLINDFTVRYVVQHSHYLLPWYYRIGATWGGHEGSLLLWVSILALWMIAVTLWRDDLETSSQIKVLVVLAALIAGFLLFLLITSNPFNRTLTSTPLLGADLNPLLQDPGLILHPPVLYMGYVGFAVVFAYGITALWQGKMSKAWFKHCRRWTMVAWAFLGVGIVMGSWWSYRELGWGGWWFWDPVENASLLPWLIATALIHSLVVSEKRDTFKAWTVLLTLLTFALSLLGTFLVRSGVLISVHAFSNDPSRGIYLLLYLFTIIGGSLLLYGLRSPKLYTAPTFNLLSRETMLLINNIFLLTAVATILLGTVYPIILDSLNLAKISVGPPYFNQVFIPLMMPLIFLMGVAPQINWHNMSWRLLYQHNRIRFILCAIASVLLSWLIASSLYLVSLISLFLAFWVLTSLQWHRNTWRTPRLLGMNIAHWGFAICLIGITISSFYNQQLAVDMQVGDRVTLAGYQFKFSHTEKLKAKNYQADVADFAITKNKKIKGQVRSELRTYYSNNAALTKTGINANAWRDLYLVVGPQLTHGYWTVRIYFKPFIRWIWLGGFLIVLGGTFTLLAKPTRRQVL